ncbi:proline iminopeptidase-family hydrolase [Flavobacterium sp.]|uniref:proline iminopeptidase-family hydrolase n=1 Tax=Flavobacterium sp. TaxID=239 RepID=UPI003D153223
MIRKLLLCFSLIAILFLSCKNKEEVSFSNYHSYQNPVDQSTGGIRMIPIKTPAGTFKVWTKRVGNNPKIKVLLLHGGPGVTHELYECFDGFFPQEGIEYIYYDQLGSYYSDQPNDNRLWTNDRFVDEVEQVRKALGLNKDNFYLLGQSWGGILAMEYAFKHQNNLKGLIISNMMSSAQLYNQYAEEVLGPQLPTTVFNQIKNFEKNKDYQNPKYQELLFNYYYTEHILRKPIKDWPEAVNRCFKHLNPNVYIYMQGPSEFGITGNATLKNWDVRQQLKNIKVPTLVIGAKHDTMDPKHMEWMSKQVQNGRFLYCPYGSHLSQYDDQNTYIPGVIKFLKDVNLNKF